MSFTEEVVISSPRRGTCAAEGTFLFPFQAITPENDRPFSKLGALYLSALSYPP
jgi:hypothetical protein